MLKIWFCPSSSPYLWACMQYVIMKRPHFTGLKSSWEHFSGPVGHGISLVRLGKSHKIQDSYHILPQTKRGKNQWLLYVYCVHLFIKTNRKDKERNTDKSWKRAKYKRSGSGWASPFIPTMTNCSFAFPTGDSVWQCRTEPGNPTGKHKKARTAKVAVK